MSENTRIGHRQGQASRNQAMNQRVNETELPIVSGEESPILDVPSISSASPQEALLEDGSSTSHEDVENDEVDTGGDGASLLEEETEGQKKKKREEGWILHHSNCTIINEFQAVPREPKLKRLRMKSPSIEPSPGLSSANILHSSESDYDIEVVYDSRINSQKSGKHVTPGTSSSHRMTRTTESSKLEGPVQKCIYFFKQTNSSAALINNILDDSDEVQYLSSTLENRTTEPTPSSGSVVVPPLENELVDAGQIVDGDQDFGYPEIEDDDELAEFQELADQMHPVSLEELFQMIEQCLEGSGLL